MIRGTVKTAREALKARGIEVEASAFLLDGKVDDVGDRARLDAPEGGSACLPHEWVLGLTFVGESYSRPGDFFRLDNGVAVTRKVGGGFALAWVS